MMSVLGIMLLITLLLALDIADPASQAGVLEVPDVPDAAAVTVQEIEALESQVRTLQAEHRVVLNRVSTLAEIAGGISDLTELEVAAAAATRQAAELADQVETIRPTLALLLEQHERAAEVEAEAQLARDKADRLVEDAAEHKQNPLLQYIPQENEGRAALLITVSENALGMGQTDPAATAIWFTARSSIDRLNQLDEALQQIDQRRHYCVVLVKPDAFAGEGDRVMQMIRERGWIVGMDLLDQHEHILVPPGDDR